jgi:hypothetical protein
MESPKGVDENEKNSDDDGDYTHIETESRSTEQKRTHHSGSSKRQRLPRTSGICPEDNEIRMFRRVRILWQNLDNITEQECYPSKSMSGSSLEHSVTEEDVPCMCSYECASKHRLKFVEDCHYSDNKH